MDRKQSLIINHKALEETDNKTIDIPRNSTQPQNHKKRTDTEQHIINSDNCTDLNYFQTEINVNKFKKPRIRTQNNYITEPKSDIEVSRDICRLIDKNITDSDETEYYEKAIEFIHNKGKTKIKSRNERAEEKKKEQVKELQKPQIKINQLSFTPGEFRLVQCSIKDKKFQSLLDSGASHSCINVNIVKYLNIKYTEQHMSMSTANGKNTHNVLGVTQIELKMSDNKGIIRIFLTKLLVLKNTNGFDLIFGADMIFNKCKSIITNDTWTIQHNEKYDKIHIPLRTKSEINKVINIEKISIEPRSHKIVQAKLSLNSIDENKDTIVYANTLDNGLIINCSLDKIRKENGYTTTFIKISNNSDKTMSIDKDEQISTAEYRQQGYEESINEATFMNIISNNPSKDEIDKEFDEFIHNPQPKQNVKFTKNEQSKQLNFTESLKEIHKKYPNELLPDNYAENELVNRTQTVVGEEYINKKFSIDDIKTGHIPAEYRQPLYKLCKEYKDIFARSNFDIGLSSNIIHNIDVKNIPPSQKQRYMTGDKLQFAEAACKKLLEADIIRPCPDPLSVTNLVLVAKYETFRDNTKASCMNKDTKKISGFRLAQDFRLLNEVTTSVRKTSSVNIDDFIAKIKGKILSTIDAVQGYFHIKLDEKSQPLTAFYLGDKIFCWTRMSQGLISSGHRWQQLTDDMFSDQSLMKILDKPHIKQHIRENKIEHFQEFLEKYVDDFFPHSENYELHLLHLRLIFEACRMANIKISPKKCKFMTTEINVLGYTLNSEQTEVFLDKAKAQSILSWEKPNSLYELMSRLCSLAYFSKFLPKFKEVAYPLFHMIRTKQFTWSSIEDKAWQRLKYLIKLDIKLTIPKKQEQLFLFSDASQISCSQILFVLKNDELKVVSCNSQIFNYLDSRKSVYIREGISLCIGIQKFRNYLECTEKQPILYTDCKSLIFAGRLKDHNSAAMQISNFLARFSQEIKFQIYHIPGAQNWLADMFSRAFESSRFIGTPALPLEQAKKIPEIPQSYWTTSEQLYTYFTAPIDYDQTGQTRNHQEKRPSLNLVKLFKHRQLPESQAINNDEKKALTHQINEKEKRTVNHFAEKSFLNHFEIVKQSSNEIYIDQTFRFKDNRIFTDQTLRVRQGQTFTIAEGIIQATVPFSTENVVHGISATFQPSYTQPWISKLIVTNESNKTILLKENTHIANITSENKCIIIKRNQPIKSNFFPPHSRHKVNKILHTENTQLNSSNHLQINDKKLAEQIDNIVLHNQQILNDDNHKSSLIKFQNNDILCENIRRDIHTKSTPYKIVQDVLYRIHKKKLLIVLPKILAKPIVTYLHQRLCHPSNTLLLQHIETNYFYPKINKIIEMVQNKCFVCLTQQPSIKNTKQTGNKRSFVPQRSREAFSIDIISDLPQNDGLNSMLIMTDLFSRYTLAYFMKNKSHNEIKKAVEQHFLCFGISKMLFSDADIALISPLQKLQKIYHFHYQTTCPKSQQGNLVENSYKTLKTFITRTIFDPENDLNRNDWVTATTLAINAYNAIPIKNSNYSKEEILFRDVLRNKLLNLDFEENSDKQILTQTQRYMLSKGKNRTEYKKPEFYEGEIIYIKYDLPKPLGTNESFAQKHRGPLKIIELHDKKRMVIARELQSAKYFFVDYNRIIKIKNPFQIKPLASNNWENVAFSEIKRATNSIPGNEIKLLSDLTEDIQTCNKIPELEKNINDDRSQIITRSRSKQNKITHTKENDSN